MDEPFGSLVMVQVPVSHGEVVEQTLRSLGWLAVSCLYTKPKGGYLRLVSRSVKCVNDLIVCGVIMIDVHVG